jgi:hexokinase
MKKALQSSCGSEATDNRRIAAVDYRSNSNHQGSPRRARTLAIDVGGTGLKASVLAWGKMIVDR